MNEFSVSARLKTKRDLNICAVRRRRRKCRLKSELAFFHYYPIKCKQTLLTISNFRNIKNISSSLTDFFLYGFPVAVAVVGSYKVTNNLGAPAGIFDSSQFDPQSLYPPSVNEPTFVIEQKKRMQLMNFGVEKYSATFFNAKSQNIFTSTDCDWPRR